MYMYIPSLHRNTFNFISIASPAFWLTDVYVYDKCLPLSQENAESGRVPRCPLIP